MPRSPGQQAVDRPERWFDTFANAVPRDPRRGYPDDVWDKVTDHARTALDRASSTVEATTTAPTPVCPPDGCRARPATDASLGTVSAANFLVAGWRQQVLNAIGQNLGRKRHFLPIQDRATQAWERDGYAVFSDIPEITLTQAPRCRGR